MKIAVILILLCVLAQLCDLGTTVILLAQGGTEMNPFLQFFLERAGCQIEALIAIKLIAITLGVLTQVVTALWLTTRFRTRLWLWVFGVWVVLALIPVGWNLLEIAKLY